MRAFTDEEFNAMIDELTQQEPMSFDMLCRIAEKALRGYVIKLCGEDPALKGRGLEDDLMQTILIKLVKTCVTSFLLRENMGGGINRDPDGFNAWMRRVAINAKKDLARAQRSRDFRTRSLCERLGDKESAGVDSDCLREKIAGAFSIVISARKSPHILLTWILQSLLMLRYGMTKINATRFMTTALCDKTLYELWELAQRYIKELPWLRLSGEQLGAFSERLDRPDKNGSIPGTVIYKDYFMKKGDAAAVSDWVNRVNSMLKGQMDHGSHNDR